MTPLKGKKYESILFEKYGLKSDYILIMKKQQKRIIDIRNMKYFREHRISKQEIIQ